MDEGRFLDLAIEFMAWEDDSWTGNALALTRVALGGGHYVAEQLVPMIRGYYKEFIWGRDRDEIVDDDFRDLFESADEYESFLDWAQSL